MSRHKVTLVLEIDDEQLDSHMASERHKTTPPYTAAVSQWDASDILYSAVFESIIEPGESYVETYHGKLDEEPDDA